MKKLSFLLFAAIVTAVPAISAAQTAGGTVLGVSESVDAAVASGWSVTHSILGKDVYNDAAKPEVVGTVDDLIVTPEHSVSYAIVNASKYLGLSTHDVAIPVEQLRLVGGKLVLPGATKNALRGLPPFQYAH